MIQLFFPCGRNDFIIHEFPLSLPCPGYILFGPQQQRHGKQLKTFNCQAKVTDKNQVNREKIKIKSQNQRVVSGDGPTEMQQEARNKTGFYGAADDCQREPGVAQLQVCSAAGVEWGCGGRGVDQAGHASCQEPCTELRGK